MIGLSIGVIKCHDATREALEPHDITEARLRGEAELRFHHELGATWQQGGGAGVPPRAWSHVVVRELAFAGRRSPATNTGLEPHGSMGTHDQPLRGGEARVPPWARSHVTTQEPTSTGRQNRSAATGP
jgi:hypothetical protein